MGTFLVQTIIGHLNQEWNVDLQSYDIGSGSELEKPRTLIEVTAQNSMKLFNIYKKCINTKLHLNFVLNYLFVLTNNNKAINFKYIRLVRK